MTDKPLRVLAACEFSGVVRDAFRARGHDAWSADFLPGEGKYRQFHYQGDLVDTLRWEKEFDLIIAFPPCTHLASSGARWFKNKDPFIMSEAVRFARWLIEYRYCGRVCVENPIGRLSAEVRKPDQIIQPWQFGHGETKATCLWLKNLPLLVPTKIVEGREGRVWKEPPGKDRWKKRSITYKGIAEAMADQWGKLEPYDG